MGAPRAARAAGARSADSRRQDGAIDAASTRRLGIVEAIHVHRIYGALLFRPKPHVDERGFFSRTFDAEVARAAGIDPAGFAQDSLSRSAWGVFAVCL